MTDPNDPQPADVDAPETETPDAESGAGYGNHAPEDDDPEA
ncbi:MULTISPECIES: hypothetical protein [unclassified Sphingomonas]|jgi:hypothetical protein|nr:MULTISPECIES: hypothetical protein [unclassified Sphingomonas]